MAAEYMNFYINNPTAGGTDGTAVSTGGTQTSPLMVALDASQSESKITKCAIRTASGYKTSGDVTISFEGDNAAKWSVAADSSYADATAAAAATFGGTLTLSDVGTTNKIFWVKATSESTESPGTDTTVTMKATGKVTPDI